MLSAKQEAVNTIFKVIGLTQLGIESEFTGPQVDSLTTSELYASMDFG